METEDIHVLRELADHREITGLVQRLAACLDERRFTEMPGLFVEEATARTPGGLAEGRAAVVAQAARNHTDDEATQHLMGDPLVDLDGDRARVRVQALVTFADAQAPSAVRRTMGELYRLEAVRTADGWRLSRVESAPAWVRT